MNPNSVQISPEGYKMAVENATAIRRESLIKLEISWKEYEQILKGEREDFSFDPYELKAISSYDIFRRFYPLSKKYNKKIEWDENAFYLGDYMKSERNVNSWK